MSAATNEDQSIRAVVGRNVARLRTERGMNAEHLADEMRTAGFSWAAQRVYELEGGRKNVSIAELLTLAATLSQSGEAVTLPTLMESDALIPVSARMGLEPQDMTTAFSGGEVVFSLTPAARGKFQQVTSRASQAFAAASAALDEWGLQDADQATLRATRSTDAADRKAAAKLDAPVWVVQMTAHRLWGQSLTEQRDALVEPGSSAQARGHITRALTEELRAEIERRHGDD